MIQIDSKVAVYFQCGIPQNVRKYIDLIGIATVALQHLFLHLFYFFV